MDPRGLYEGWTASGPTGGSRAVEIHVHGAKLAAPDALYPLGKVASIIGSRQDRRKIWHPVVWLCCGPPMALSSQTALSTASTSSSRSTPSKTGGWEVARFLPPCPPYAALPLLCIHLSWCVAGPSSFALIEKYLYQHVSAPVRESLKAPENLSRAPNKYAAECVCRRYHTYLDGPPMHWLYTVHYRTFLDPLPPRATPPLPPSPLGKQMCPVSTSSTLSNLSIASFFWRNIDPGVRLCVACDLATNTTQYFNIKYHCCTLPGTAVVRTYLVPGTDDYV